MLCCSVLCCAARVVPCCVVSYCVVMRGVGMCCVVLCCAVLCCAVLCCASLRRILDNSLCIRSAFRPRWQVSIWGGNLWGGYVVAYAYSLIFIVLFNKRSNRWCEHCLKTITLT